MTAIDPIRALEVASRLQNGQSTPSDRQWAASVLMTVAEQSLLPPKLKNRPRKNDTRDFWFTMNYLLAGENEKTVARAWELTVDTGSIIKRMRGNCEAVLAGFRLEKNFDKKWLMQAVNNQLVNWLSVSKVPTVPPQDVGGHP